MSSGPEWGLARPGDCEAAVGGDPEMHGKACPRMFATTTK